MAKIVAEFDTVSKALEVTIDGTAVEDVQHVDMFRSFSDEEEFHADVVTMTKDPANDTRTFTRLSASESPDGKESLEKSQASESKQFPGFVEARASHKDSKVQDDIAKYIAG